MSISKEEGVYTLARALKNIIWIATRQCRFCGAYGKPEGDFHDKGCLAAEIDQQLQAMIESRPRLNGQEVQGIDQDLPIQESKPLRRKMSPEFIAAARANVAKAREAKIIKFEVRPNDLTDLAACLSTRLERNDGNN